MLLFGDVLDELKNGQCLTRMAWTPDGEKYAKWITLRPAATYKKDSELFEDSEVLMTYALGIRSKSVDVASCIVLKDADGSLVFGWLPSTVDMFANDWLVIP